MISNMSAAKLNKSLFSMLVGGGVIFILVIGTYFIAHTGWTLSLSNAAWGQFGDYVGGLLNPVFGFLAFFGLLLTIALQATELEESRKATKETRKATQETIQVARDQAKLVLMQTEHLSREQKLNDLDKAIRMQSDFIDQQCQVGIEEYDEGLGPTTRPFEDVLFECTQTYYHEDTIPVMSDKLYDDMWNSCCAVAEKLERMATLLEQYDDYQETDDRPQGNYTNGWRLRYFKTVEYIFAMQTGKYTSGLPDGLKERFDPVTAK